MKIKLELDIQTIDGSSPLEIDVKQALIELIEKNDKIKWYDPSLGRDLIANIYLDNIEKM